jgi:hypothetical protein
MAAVPLNGDTSEFLRRFQEFVGATGWRKVLGPSQLVGQWEGFVETCEEGYGDTIYEYENERSVRDFLESVLSDPVLGQFEAIVGLRESVGAVDARFRAACRGDVQIGRTSDAWWRRCVPEKVEGDFAEDLMSQYGIARERTRGKDQES